MACRTDLKNRRNICFELLRLPNQNHQLIHCQLDYFQQEEDANPFQVRNVNAIQVIIYLLYLRQDLWYHSILNSAHPYLLHCSFKVKM